MPEPIDYGALLSQAMGLGEEDQRLQLQLAQARKLRESARAPMQSRGPLSGFMEAVGAGIDNYTGRRDEAAATTGLAGVNSRRRQIAGSLPTSFGPSVAEVLTTDDPDLMDSRSVLAGKGVEQRRALARALGADPGLAKLGEGYAKEADAVEKQLDPGVLKLALADRKSADAVKAQAAALERAGRHEEAATLRARISASAPRFGFSATPGTPDVGYVVDQRTGAIRPVGEGARLGPDGGLLGKSGAADRHPDFQKFVYKTAPAFATSRSVIGQDQSTANRIARAQILMDSKKLGGMTAQEVEDVTLALAGVLTGGSVAARTTIDNLSYNTLRMSAEKALQFITNSPRDAHAQEFITRIAGILKNEYKGAKDRIKVEVKQPAIGLRQVLGHPEVRRDAEDYLRSFGMNDADMAEIFGPVAQPAAPRPGAPAAPAAPKSPALGPPPPQGDPGRVRWIQDANAAGMSREQIKAALGGK